MSKSLGNALFLSDTPETISKKVMSMYTDPNHVHASDPGNVEGNMVFAYLDIFDPRKKEIEELKAHYRRGGLGDVAIKKRLNDVLQELLAPLRERRNQYAQDLGHVMAMLHEGSLKVREVAAATMAEVRRAMKIDYF